MIHNMEYETRLEGFLRFEITTEPALNYVRIELYIGDLMVDYAASATTSVEDMLQLLREARPAQIDMLRDVLQKLESIEL